MLSGDTLVADFITATRWEDLSERVQDKSRMCLMDNLAATISGVQTRVSQAAADFAAEFLAGSESTILVSGRSSSAAGAAFANGCAANALDTDDCARYAYGHAGAQLFPTALALSESQHLGGKELLTAMVVGYEVAHRIGRCWHDHHEIYQACGSWGAVACSAAAAHLLRLDRDQTVHALGIAEYHAPNLPMMRDIENPAMVKHGTGWGAVTGISSAQLASRGFTGIPTLLSFEKYRPWVEDIGREYIMVDGVGWKRKGYACCGWAHAAAEGARRVAIDNDLSLGRISRIIVETFRESAALGTRLPETTEEAQFNLGWPVAAMLVDKEIGPAQTLETRLHDPVTREIAEKVEIVESDELNQLCRLFQRGDPRGRFASRVTVVLDNGSELASGLVDGGLSYPPPGWGEDVMEEKFRWLVAPVLGEERTERLITMVWSFEEQQGMEGLIRATGGSQDG